MKRSIHLIAFTLLFAGTSHSATTLVRSNVYAVSQGVSFNISNSGASSFLISWSDSGGTFTDIVDPTLILTSGQSYSFQRTTGSHPFAIADDSLPVTGSDGSFSRTTTDGAVINAAILSPTADFTADPAPTTDQISWTPGVSDEGDYFYTCTITSHSGMVGAIQVVPEPSSSLLMACGLAGVLLSRRRK